MLDTKADGERLGLEIDAASLQHTECISGAVSEGDHDVTAAQYVSILECDPFDLVFFHQQISHLALKAYLPTQRHDLLAHRRYDACEAIGADVWLTGMQNLRRCTGSYELPQHLSAVELWVLDLAIQLTVGEQTRAALAELHVGFRGQRVLSPQGPGILRATPNFSPALQHYGPKACLRKNQGREQPAGTKTDDQRAFLQWQ